ncbi:UvrD-helicase domain-containing protein [Brachybacterium tyrofermentans]|uniref:UvrD-helicase domain-containing protein n=1 Tax=Brachybacterium tyrofermentans TaxID=47848 RepID=UPI003FD0B843
MKSNVIIDSEMFTDLENRLFTKVQSTIKKLRNDWRSPGLHVEPIEQAKDSRVRTARVNQQYRLVLFHLEESPKDVFYVEGVYNHDDAYDVAGSKFLRVNDVSGQFEVRRRQDVPQGRANNAADSEIKRRAAELAAAQQAKRELEEAARNDTAPVQEPKCVDGEESSEPPPHPPTPSGPALHVSVEDLVDVLGMDREIAERAVMADEVELLEIASYAPRWQGEALVELATGRSIQEVKEAFRTEATSGTPADVPTDSDDVLKAIHSGGSRRRFLILDEDEEYADVLEHGDFAAWHVFLHPDQRRYVDLESSGPFRLTGGAGTGKTVVLIHRAVRLAGRATPAPRIVLTTFTRGLAESLKRQLRSLDPDHQVAKSPGDPGIYVGGIDQISRFVVNRARDKRGVMADVLGWGQDTLPRLGRPSQDWDRAISDAGVELPEQLRSSHFFATEYSEIVLPQRLLTEQDYMRAGRAGRGTKLGRLQRRAVWAVISRYRDEGMRNAALDWDELSAVAARALDAASEKGEPRPVDHLLIDEAQDARPPHWQMFRAITVDGPDDLFIAEDSHQRIYGNRVVLKRYGIGIVGRSRRLRLNYRTTAENLRFAMAVLAGGDYQISDAEEGAFEEQSGAYRSARSGPAPQMLRSETLSEEYDDIARLVQQWVADMAEVGLDPSSLGILTHEKFRAANLVAALGERGVRIRHLEREAPSEGLPLVLTLHTAKGMEFSRVILFGMSAESIPANRRGMDYDEDAILQARQRERSLLYVGATRARDYLAVSWNDEPSEFIAPALEDKD